ncbi:MAG TPA: hemolysin family protein [Gemmatimonadota bacterium]|nr:hemolysin family protein [Gemmatimonadota bacterium]
MESDHSGLDILFRLLAVLLLVAANGFFVASEFALVTVRRTRIDELVQQGHTLAKAVKRALEDIDAYIAAAQLGITMASLGLGWIGEPALAALIEPLLGWLPGDSLATISAHTISIIIAFTIITALHIVLGEQAPKTMAIQRSERAALFVALPTKWFLTLFKPFIWVLNTASLMVVRAFGFAGTTASHHVPHTEEELKMIVSASTAAGVLAPEEEEMIHNIFELADLTANQVMIPRTEIVGLRLSAPRDDIEATLRQHGFTRYPVYDGSLDSIVGIVNVKELLSMLDGRQAFDLRHAMQNPVVLPESVRVFQLLAAMQAQKRHVVVLIDEFGGTAGIVTLRDVLERIVGDVRSEKDPGWPDIERISDREALIDGLLLIQDVNEEFRLELDEEEYHTIGGYVFGALGRRPEVGDVIEAQGCRLVVEALDGMRVSRLRIGLEQPAPTADTAD